MSIQRGNILPIRQNLKDLSHEALLIEFELASGWEDGAENNKQRKEWAAYLENIRTEILSRMQKED